jgi:glycosyltransferase involved in cell wall biosynthesis
MTNPVGTAKGHRAERMDQPDDPALRLIAPHVDAAFYRQRNPDVAAAGQVPAEHYWRSGWREGRDPNAWFDTGYYLRANPDIAAAGLNPLWHFLVQGRSEGRQPRPPGAVWRAALDEAAPLSPALRDPLPAPAGTAATLGPEELRRLLAAACANARGFVVALSHDRYLEVPGGTQLLIADEQRKFNGDLAAYLHLSPVVSGLGLAPDGPEPLWLNVILDGAVRGVATAGAAIVAFTALPPELPKLLAIHSLHGHRPEAVAALAGALQPAHAFFWVHDYGAACDNPRLLRNGVAFCHAPPPTSMACRICVHGEHRPRHLARMQALFEAVAFHVVAPSQLALEIWRHANPLPCLGVHLHPHAALQPLPAGAATRDGPARVAFVGHAEYHKGFPLFRELVCTAPDLRDYRFFQFASATELRAMADVTLVAAESSAARPFGMLQALADHRIDLLLALSPWPETFGFVAHEALAAGADIVTLAGSGNIAEIVRETGRGVVLADAAALFDYFSSGLAAEHVRQQRAAGRQPAALRHTGSTATLSLTDPADRTTGDPDLHLLIRGERLDGAPDGGGLRFSLPAPGPRDERRMVRLRTRNLRNGWEPGSGGDRRRLGVAVTTLLLDGVAIPPGDPRRGTGWHKPEADWQWTDGDATILVGTARSLEVSFVRLARYWRSPLLNAP